MSKKILYAFIISFLLLITVIILNRFSFTSMRKYSQQIDHTRLVISVFDNLSNHFKSAQIYTTENDTGSAHELYSLYLEETNMIIQELSTLRQLVADNKDQVKLADSLSALIKPELAVLLQNNVTQVISRGETSRLATYQAVHQMINRGIQREESLLVERKHSLVAYTHLNNLLTTSFGVLAGGILMVTFISNLFISRHRKWLEGFLESILNTSQNAIVHYKAVREDGKIVDFTIEFANKAVRHLLGIDPEKAFGKRFSEFPSYVFKSDLFRIYSEVVETGTAREFETFFDGEAQKRWLLVNLAKMDDGLIATFNDISQLKRYEAELKENITRLEQSNTELEQYAYVASHDLQEPLRKIRSFGSYLEDTESSRLGEKGQQYLRKIIAAAERMSALIKDILSFSAISKQEAFVPVDLNNTLSSVLQDLDLMLAQKNALVKSEQLPVIDAIPLQMTQLFYNLINNSLKFSSEDRQPVITITCRKLRTEEWKAFFLKDTEYYEILVKDNGIGFSSEYTQQIFGLFKRLNDKQTYAGSGIGLALCKKVAENHHGEIIAEGKEHVGASFAIHLPEKITA